MNTYFDGSSLYGDDFSPEQIMRWFADEEQASFELSGNYEYNHHGLSWYHGWRHLPKRQFSHLISFGGSTGVELRDILPRVDRVTILEPATGFTNPRFTYVRPQPSGIIPFSDNSFDLLTCFGVMHHIPNVSTIVREFFRVLTPGGYAVIREPIVSMGDWTKLRPGLTPHERGIPIAVFDKIVEPFEVVHRGKALFRPIRAAIDHQYNRKTVAALDAWLCSLPWPITYHATRGWQKFAPVAICYVLKKP